MVYVFVLLQCVNSCCHNRIIVLWFGCQRETGSDNRDTGGNNRVRVAPIEAVAERAKL